MAPSNKFIAFLCGLLTIHIAIVFKSIIIITNTSAIRAKLMIRTYRNTVMSYDSEKVIARDSACTL